MLCIPMKYLPLLSSVQMNRMRSKTGFVSSFVNFALLFILQKVKSACLVGWEISSNTTQSPGL